MATIKIASECFRCDISICVCPLAYRDPRTIDEKHPFAKATPGPLCPGPGEYELHLKGSGVFVSKEEYAKYKNSRCPDCGKFFDSVPKHRLRNQKCRHKHADRLLTKCDELVKNHQIKHAAGLGKEQA